MFIILGTSFHNDLKHKFDWYDLSVRRNVSYTVQRYIVYNTKGINYIQTQFPQYIHEKSDSMLMKYAYYLPSIGYTYVKEEFRNDIVNYYPKAKFVSKAKMSYAIMDIPLTEVMQFLKIAKQKNIQFERMFVLSFGGRELDFRESLVPLILEVANSSSLTPVKIDPIMKAEVRTVLDFNLFRSYLLVVVYSSLCFLLFNVIVAIQESSKWQGTLGKFIVGIKVVDHDGNRISFHRAFIRGLYRLLSFSMLLIGYLYIFGKSHRCLHDIWSKTYVVDE